MWRGGLGGERERGGGRFPLPILLGEREHSTEFDTFQGCKTLFA